MMNDQEVINAQFPKYNPCGDMPILNPVSLDWILEVWLNNYIAFTYSGWMDYIGETPSQYNNDTAGELE